MLLLLPGRKSFLGDLYLSLVSFLLLMLLHYQYLTCGRRILDLLASSLLFLSRATVQKELQKVSSATKKW